MTTELKRHRFTVEDYHRLADLGFLGPDLRTELLEGEIIEMATVREPHAECVDLLAARFIRGLDPAIRVRVQNPVRLSALSEPLPDLVIARARPGGFLRSHPEPGEIFPPGGLLDVDSDLSRPWLTVWVDEPSLAAIRLGDGAEVAVDGHSGRFPATVSWVSPVAEFTPTNVQTPDERAKLVFRVKLDLDNPDGVFKPGMPADAYFGRASARQPLEAHNP